MTTGTVHAFDPTRGTGTITCDTGARVPFSLKGGRISAGDRVSFVPFGGRTGIYALDVRRATRPHARIHTLETTPRLRTAA